MTENLIQRLNKLLNDDMIVDINNLITPNNQLQTNLNDEDLLSYDVLLELLTHYTYEAELKLPKYTQPQILDTLTTLKDNINNKYIKALAYNSLIYYGENKGEVITPTIKLFYELTLKLYNEININDDWKIYQNSDFLRLLEHTFTLAQTYKNKDYILIIKPFIISALKEIKNEIIFRSLIGLLKKYKLKEITQDIQEIVESKTKYFLSLMFKEKEYQRIFFLLYTVCGFFHFVKDHDKVNLILRYQAIIYQKEVIYILNTDNIQKYTKVHNLYARALDKYTLITMPSIKIKKNMVRINKLHQKYAQLKSSEYNTFSVDIKLDIKDYDNICKNIEEQNNNIQDLLLEMTKINLPTFSYLKEHYGKKQYLHDIIMTKVHYTEDGKQAINKSKSVEIEKIYGILPHAIMCLNMRTDLYRNHLLTSNIHDGLWSNILNESFLKNNTIVPQNQIQTYIKAITAGFKDDFLTSSYIIPSLIENMLRNILKQEGEYTWKNNNKAKDLQEEDRNINTFLGNDEYKKIFSELPFLGEDLIFYLEYLLVAKIGVNFRNEIYHGLYDDNIISGYRNSHNSKFLWWIFIKIIVHGKIHSLTQESI